ncbi:ATP-grasp domain-containing protein [Halopiger djelfimassiliensis]|uniref:ATP-grasp domain-containing protein n=1 Tax=Halopiger djelfimassiliensis TaxID=1293047 RepID=UPI000677E7DA|nr:ATP-grasp domain-containing protein [Halopiger djelfimassiliensis]
MGVLLLGPGSDPQLTAVENELEQRSVETTVWDADEWPDDGSLTVRQDGATTRLAVGDTAVDPSSIHTVYLRNFALNPRLPDYRDRLEERPFALINQLREYQAVVESMLAHLADRGVRLVNPLDTLDIHRQKPWQLSVLGGAGIPIPNTLTTTDPDAVRAFADRVDEVVYKPVGGGGYASLLTDDDLTDDRLELLSNSPVQFQERIEGEDIRLFVVGGEVVAAARIVSDELDYRTEDHDVERIDPASLETDLERAAVETAAALDLSFAGVDIVAGADRFCVLEANPSPMFAAFDDLAGTDVAGALAEFLATPDTGDRA